jgi:Fur family peroxide stress response transcriptional regulator
MTPSIDHVRSLFRNHDLRCTRQRELVYTALASTTAHPTAEELYRAVHDVEPGLSLSTVYNTLEALVDCGLGRRLSNGAGPCHYDADMAPHVHLSMGDGEVRDVPEDLSHRLLAGVSPDLLKELEDRMGIKVASVNLQVVAAAAAQPRACRCAGACAEC